MNVFQKLINARAEFIQQGIKKSGKNKGLCYSYFELEDIVPIATAIFQKIGLVSLVNFDVDMATMTLVNTDDPSDCITFSTPIKYADVNKGTTEIQALGSTHTYIRRYLYMMCLDIVEADMVDGGIFDNKPTETPQTEVPKTEPKKSAPKTPTERTEIKKELTDKYLDDTMIKTAEEKLVHILRYHPNEEEVQNWFTNYEKREHFTKVEKKNFKNLLTSLDKAIGECGTELLREVELE